jgi:glutaredoxin
MYFGAVDHDTVAIMFSTKWCPYCRKTKEYFAANKIAYIERDVESSDEDMTAFLDLGGQAYPLILLRNRKIIGFQKNALDQLLGISPES